MNTVQLQGEDIKKKQNPYYFSYQTIHKSQHEHFEMDTLIGTRDGI